jgi:hypothetical protein
VSTTTDWAIPSGLSERGKKAAAAIVAFLKERDMSDPCGGGRFYTPDEWDERDEQYGLGSLLIITHDGGEHAPAFNWDYEAYDLMEDLRQELLKIDVYVEQCTSWFSAIYPIRRP